MPGNIPAASEIMDGSKMSPFIAGLTDVLTLTSVGADGELLLFFACITRKKLAG